MPEPSAPAPRDPDARRLLALAVALGALLLLGLGLPLWGSEGRWLVVARGMARSGEAFNMNLGGHPYFDKPIGSYWLVLAAAWVLGGFGEAAGRLPCILALLATLLVTFELGRRTLGERAGAIAALLLRWPRGCCSGAISPAPIRRTCWAPRWRCCSSCAPRRAAATARSRCSARWPAPPR